MENDKFKKIPVIMMSTDRETKNIAACLKKGAKNYIVKPIKPLFLKKTLEDNIKQEITTDNIDPDLIQYQRLGIIGFGATGQVQLVKRLNDGNKFALKIINL